MKEYLILKDFKGTQDGHGKGETFLAGSIAPLSDSLVQALGGVDSGYVKEASAAAAEIAEAPPALAEAVLEGIADAELQPRELADGEMLEEVELPEESKAEIAEDRETKVVVPEETKPVKKPFAKKGSK